jgi:thiol-disulfide isomerase/thioredoxin
MKAKTLLSFLVIILLVACQEKPVSPDTPYIIEGELTGVKDGLEITLFQFDGDVGSLLAKDTIQGGKFFFKEQMSDPELNVLMVYVSDDDFPSAGRRIYTAPGAHIKVKGHDSRIMSWSVESLVPEQKDYDALNAIPEYEVLQDLIMAFGRTINELNSVDRETEKERYAEVRNRYSSINNQLDSTYSIYYDKVMDKMMGMKPSQPFMRTLKMLSSYSNSMPDRVNPEKAKAIYQSLPDDIKQSIEGMTIYGNLYPPKQAMDGDDFPDADFYDLNGNLHHIAEHKGKYILLDFWSSGCGPCIKAFPEMKEMYEKYGERLAIISMSIDTERRWRKASEEHDITWSNWSEGKGEGGIYANYRVVGIPYYVLINPDGKIEKQIMGYREGQFKKLFSEVFD